MFTGSSDAFWAGRSCSASSFSLLLTSSEPLPSPLVNERCSTRGDRRHPDLPQLVTRVGNHGPLALAEGALPPTPSQRRLPVAETLAIGAADGARVAASAVAIVAALLLLLRLLGQRSVARMTTFDVAVVLVLGAAGGRVITGRTPHTCHWSRSNHCA